MTISHSGRVELCLGSLTYQDSGTYTCVATNEVGRAETSAHVEVGDRSRGEVSTTYPAEVPKIIAQDIP